MLNDLRQSPESSELSQQAHLHHRFVIQEVQVSTGEVRESAVRRDRAGHVLVEHLVVHDRQLQIRWVPADRQAEEDHLHHWQREDEQHHSAKNVPIFLVSNRSTTSSCRVLSFSTFRFTV